VFAVADEDVLRPLLVRHGRAAGLSAPVGWRDLPRGLTEARKAAERTRPGRPVVGFEALADEGLLGFLDAAGAEPVARRVLAPVLDSEDPDHRALLATAAVWLEHNGAWEPAAKELHVHRHTLRSRLATLERLLDLDLGRFADRAELWTALQLVQQRGQDPPHRT
jgi:purine catabolism regulator